MNEGDAEQGALLACGQTGVGRGRIQKRPLGRQGDECVQRRVQALDPTQEVPVSSTLEIWRLAKRSASSPMRGYASLKNSTGLLDHPRYDVQPSGHGRCIDLVLLTVIALRHLVGSQARDLAVERNAPWA